MTHIYGIDDRGREWELAANAVATKIKPAAADIDRDARFPADAIKELVHARLLGLCLSEEVGGQGQPPGVFAAVVEQLAQACPSTAMVYVMHVSASQAIAASETFDQRKAVIAEIAAGQHLSTLALSERGSRSQFWAPVSKLRSGSGDLLSVSAAKSWVTSANYADSYVASSQKPDAESPAESTLYFVRRQSRGVQVAGAFNGLGLRGNDSAPVGFNDLSITPADLLTQHGEGATMMLQVILPWFIVGTAAMAHGICLASVAACAEHLSSSSFEHSGQKLRDLPNLRARLAEMSCRSEQSRGLLGFAVASMLAPDARTPLVLLQARLAALGAACDVTDLAMKTCGGAAFSRQLPVERMFRDARAGWVMAPTVDHLHDFVGRALVGLPLF
jgi:alkylation response protein AidB-like acyl-CoA dehydrogenase